MKQVILFLLFILVLGRDASSFQFEVFSKEGKVGLKDESGNILIPAEYEALGWSNGSEEVVNDRIGYAKNGLWGLLSISNNKISGTSYSILYPSKNFFVAAQKGKVTRRDFVGLINKDAKVVVPFQYTSISHHGTYIIAGDASRSGYLYGVLGTSGQQILPVSFKSVMPLSDAGFAVQLENNQFDIYTASGQVLLPRKLDQIEQITSNRWRIRKGIMQGLLNARLQLERRMLYSTIIADKDNNEIVLKKHNQWVFYDEALTAIDTVYADNIIPVAPETYLLSNGNDYQLYIQGQPGTTVSGLKEIKRGVYLYKEGDEFALLKASGETVVLPKSDSIRISNDNVLIHTKFGWTVYDTFGIKKSATYAAIQAMNERYWKVQKHGKWGLLNRSGEEVAWCTYDDIHAVVDDMATVSFHGTRGIISTEGSWYLNPIKADSLQLVGHNRYFVHTDSLTRIYDEHHDLVYFTNNKIEPVAGGYVEYLKTGGQWRIGLDGTIEENASPYEEIRALSEGYIAIRKNGLYGFIDERNRLRIANRYDAVGDFNEGLAAFKLLGKWGYLNKREQIVIQPQFITASDFQNNMAIVSTAEGFGLLDQFGKKHSAFDYDKIDRVANGFRVIKNGKIGLLDIRGNLRVQTKYDQLVQLPTGLIKVKQFGQFGLLDSEGLTRLSIIFDDLVYDQENGVYLVQKKSSFEKLPLQ